MINIVCAICGKKQKTRILYPSNLSGRTIDKNTFSARRVPENLHYRLNQCLNCNLIISSPILNKNKIIKLYQGSKFTYDTEASLVGKTYVRYLNKYIDRLSTESKVLDVGCGNGFFLDELYKLGYRHFYGVEPSHEAVSKAPKYLQKRIKIAILRPRLFEKSFFNLITCFHTLDHIIDPNVFINITRGLLKKGGLAYFVVHDTQGLSVKLLGENSPIFDVEHIYLFSKSTLRKIFEKNGFGVINVFDLKNTYSLSYWSRALPLPSLFKKLMAETLKISGLGNISITLNAGNIGIIAKRN